MFRRNWFYVVKYVDSCGNNHAVSGVISRSFFTSLSDDTEVANIAFDEVKDGLKFNPRTMYVSTLNRF